MVTIRCVVERITYQNPENGYSVLKVRVKGYQDLVPVVGPLADAVVGSVLLIEGNWKIDARYGRQFAAVRWEETVPATVYGIEKYLGSGLIKGIGPKFAKKIVGQFGTDSISVIEERPEALLEVWAKLVGALPRGGVMAVDFFGPHDSWAELPDVATLPLHEIDAMFRDFHVIDRSVRDEDGRFLAEKKHWHVITTLARKVR